MWILKSVITELCIKATHKERIIANAYVLSTLLHNSRKSAAALVGPAEADIPTFKYSRQSTNRVHFLLSI